MSRCPTPDGSGGLRRLSAVTLACASLLAAAGLGSLFLRTAVDAWEAMAAAGPAGPADGILAVTGLAGSLLTLWLGLGTALSALSALPGAVGQLSRELADRVAPAAVRKGVAFVLGTTLTAAFLPGTAVAELSQEARPGIVAMGSVGARDLAGSTAAVSGEGRTGTASLADGAPDASFRLVAEHDARSDASDRGDGAKVTEAAPSAAWSLDRAGATTVNDRVVVLRGDTLWSIAARHLGPQAGAAAIDSEWRRWFALNRQVIGEDADLILPGQLLARPVSSQTSGRTEGAAAPRSGLGAGS